MNEHDAYLALNLIPPLTPRRLGRLVDRLGSAAAVWQASAWQLARAGLAEELACRIVAERARARVDEERALAQRHRVTILTRGQADYPAALAAIHDPPPVLYLRGGLLPQDALAVAIVGSRRASYYGISTAERLAGELAARGITVVSGLARGIDAAAHRGALRAGGRTLAVLGSGLLRLYPQEHERLAEEIAAAGAVVSEFPLAAPPLAGHFPRRNRLISGLALGVVVVEAASHSGALITADCALEQGREVFAVPGQVSAATARGANDLLRDGARLVTSADDVLEALDLAAHAAVPVPPARAAGAAPASSGTAEEARLLACLSDEPRSVDELAAACGWPSPRVLSTLTHLELRGAIKRLPGQQYVKE